jgi:two-component system, LuxR family, sensor kinase FixL
MPAIKVDQQMAAELEDRAFQQAGVAELGLHALESMALPSLMDEAAALVARTLRVEYCQILELLPDENRLLLRAGVGWPHELIGQMSVGTTADSQAGYTLLSSKPVMVENLGQETRFSDLSLLHTFGVVSGLSVVIPRRDHPFGVLAVHTIKHRIFTDDDIHFLQAIANVLATAIERSQTEAALRESQDKFQALLEAAPVAVVIVDNKGQIVLVNAKTEMIFGYNRLKLIGQTLEILLPERFRQIHTGHRTGYLADPRIRPMGLGLDLAGRRKDGTEFPVEIGLSFTETGSEVLGISFITDITERKQAEAALQTAVAAERNRLARDLHDAVTQTLFSASLIAEVLPRLWELNPAEGEKRLEELRQLTRGALAEMRTLLLELRPAALMEVELADLLRQLTEAITGRARVSVALTVEGYHPLLPDVRVALYRIAQETLNNVAKHSGANQAVVNLRYEEAETGNLGAASTKGSPAPPPWTAGGRRQVRVAEPEYPQGASGSGQAQGSNGPPALAVVLRISDDGRGFDPDQVSPESLGLGIMRERAEAIGAALTIESRVGHGTQVSVVWKDSN